MKILAIDHGTKNIGLAISDELEIASKPLPLLRIKNQKHAIDLIKQLVEKERIEKILLGLPTGLSGKDSNQSKLVREFSKDLEKFIKLPIILWDETYSSKSASKITKKNLDSEAAAILLQEYLNSDMNQ